MVTKTEKKGEKTSLGSKILSYVPWRIALTAAAFAIPVAGPIVGTAVGALTYGNYRKNNRTENEESRKESTKPSRLKKFLFRVGIVAIGFLFGGVIGAVIAGGLVAIDSVSNGKLIQGAEKVLDAGYDALSTEGERILDAGKTAFSKTKEAQEPTEKCTGEEKPVEKKDHSRDNRKVDFGARQGVKGGKSEAELKRRESSASLRQVH